MWAEGAELMPLTSASTGFEAMQALILKSYLAGNFTSLVHAVNSTNEKKAGAVYWNSANNRLVVSSGNTPGATWHYFTPAGTYTPA